MPWGDCPGVIGGTSAYKDIQHIRRTRAVVQPKGRFRISDWLSEQPPGTKRVGTDVWVRPPLVDSSNPVAGVHGSMTRRSLDRGRSTTSAAAALSNPSSRADCSRMRNFWILPLTVIGNPSVTFTYRGTL